VAMAAPQRRETAAILAAASGVASESGARGSVSVGGGLPALMSTSDQPPRPRRPSYEEAVIGAERSSTSAAALMVPGGGDGGDSQPLLNAEHASLWSRCVSSVDMRP
jgi:hypothetical protein